MEQNLSCEFMVVRLYYVGCWMFDGGGYYSNSMYFCAVQLGVVTKYIFQAVPAIKVGQHC